MSARGAATFVGSFVVCFVIAAMFGWAAAYFYFAGIVVGPCVYLHRAPWNL